jgi:hypothetical protein
MDLGTSHGHAQRIASSHSSHKHRIGESRVVNPHLQKLSAMQRFHLVFVPATEGGLRVFSHSTQGERTGCTLYACDIN